MNFSLFAYISSSSSVSVVLRILWYIKLQILFNRIFLLWPVNNYEMLHT